MTDFRQLVVDAAPEDLPALVGKLAEAQAVAMARLTVPPPPASPFEVLTVDEAVKIAKLPNGDDAERARSRKRIYEWARKATWATRTTKRCLRIDGAGFRRWLCRSSLT